MRYAYYVYKSVVAKYISILGSGFFVAGFFYLSFIENFSKVFMIKNMSQSNFKLTAGWPDLL